MNKLDENASKYSIDTLSKLCKVCCRPYKNTNNHCICKECWEDKGYKELIEKQTKKTI